MVKPWVSCAGLCVLLVLSTQPCRSEPGRSGAEPPVEAGVKLQNAWVRALPPGQTRTAAYLSLNNAGAEVITVIGARADVAARTELHNSREVDGMMRMEPVATLSVEPGESIEFSPGGLHLMLLDLQRMPAVGERVSLCLELAGQSPLCTSAPVLRDAAAQSDDPHRHH